MCVHKIKEVFASLYNDRAIAYRVHHGFKHEDVFLSAGVQLMVRSDVGASGVLFTLDTESGFRDAVFVTASYGLGEIVVQGAVNPDEFYVYKPTLRAGKHGDPAPPARQPSSSAWSTRASPASACASRRRRPPIAPSSASPMPTWRACRSQALVIEKHYDRPMDIEWAKDGVTGKIYIVQARPETVKSRARAAQIERYHLQGARRSAGAKAARSASGSAPARARVVPARSRT